MLECADARVLARLALALPDHRGRRTQRVADQDRLREAHLFPTEVPERRAVGGVVHREADQEPEREYAVHDALTEGGALRILGVQVQASRSEERRGGT